MKKILFVIIAAAGLAFTGFGQEKTSADKWAWLTGDWRGEGSGQPGQGSGTFSFTPELEKNILVRRSHSEYPATAAKPKIVHDDLMIVYGVRGGDPSQAIYFDNEGHTINYTIAYAESAIVLTSTKVQNMPVFRLTYTLLNDGAVNAAFEMSQDGTHFFPYVQGKSRKIQ